MNPNNIGGGGSSNVASGRACISVIGFVIAIDPDVLGRRRHRHHQHTHFARPPERQPPGRRPDHRGDPPETAGRPTAAVTTTNDASACAEVRVATGPPRRPGDDVASAVVAVRLWGRDARRAAALEPGDLVRFRRLRRPQQQQQQQQALPGGEGSIDGGQLSWWRGRSAMAVLHRLSDRTVPAEYRRRHRPWAASGAFGYGNNENDGGGGDDDDNDDDGYGNDDDNGGSVDARVRELMLWSRSSPLLSALRLVAAHSVGNSGGDGGGFPLAPVASQPPAAVRGDGGGDGNEERAGDDGTDWFPVCTLLRYGSGTACGGDGAAAAAAGDTVWLDLRVASTGSVLRCTGTAAAICTALDAAVPASSARWPREAERSRLRLELLRRVARTYHLRRRCVEGESWTELIG
ncbi:hypothetical protein HK405_004889 [Cladochytrium tenue]|nr:hypothetical protein HK405_004889 [Cladochytrium tenue]